MKKILLLVVILFLTVNIYSKNKDFKFDSDSTYVITSIIEKNIWRNNTIKHSYFHDSKFRIVLELFEELSDTGWVKTRRENLTYNSYGDTTLFYSESWRNNNWNDLEKRHFKYDLKGNRISHLQEMWYTDHWQNTQRDTFAYDSNNDLTLFITQLFSNNQWRNARRITNTYDSNGKL